jgi:hypothetical protein
MQVKFRIPDGFSVPSGQALGIYFFDGSTWAKLSVSISEGFVFAHTNQTGIFVFVVEPDS